MFGNDKRMSQELDNYITGHYGEDQFKTRRKIGGSKRHIHQHGQPKICPDCFPAGSGSTNNYNNGKDCWRCHGTGKLQA